MASGASTLARRLSPGGRPSWAKWRGVAPHAILRSIFRARRAPWTPTD